MRREHVEQLGAHRHGDPDTPGAPGLLHVLNVATHDVRVRLLDGDAPLLGGETLSLRAQTALLLPLDVPVFGGAATVRWAATDITERTADTLAFAPPRLPGPPARVCITWDGITRVLDAPAGPLTRAEARDWFAAGL